MQLFPLVGEEGQPGSQIPKERAVANTSAIFSPPLVRGTHLLHWPGPSGFQIGVKSLISLRAGANLCFTVHRSGAQSLFPEGKQEGGKEGREGGKEEDGLRGGSTCLCVARPEFISGLSPDNCLQFSGLLFPYLENKDGIPCLSAQMWDQINNQSVQMLWAQCRGMLRHERELLVKGFMWFHPAQLSKAKIRSPVCTNPCQQWVS